ncbi:MAG TPA: nucleotide excision repair endonuclease [Candidatus Eisenbacteria bacterium]|nr:nucleotide excision repair endonuclease [Candidatus Eisenbacteria bacterium]
MDLPDIYFLFVRRRGEQPFLFHRESSGDVRWVVSARRIAPAPGSLFLHGPGAVTWDVALLDLVAMVRDRGGAALPLSAVLERYGISKRKRSQDLLLELGGTRVEIEDPRIEGREILERLAERLGSLDSLDEVQPSEELSPGPLLVSDVMTAPEAPGVYTFLSSEGRAIYVGKAKSLRRRLGSHLRGRAGEPAKRTALIEGATEVRWERTGSELEALLREHLALRRERPSVNLQRRAHPRDRGAWRERRVAILLPSAVEGFQEVMLIGGDGGFHTESVLMNGRLPRGFWKRTEGFLDRSRVGWGPGRERIDASLAAELAEIALSWLVVHGSEVTQIDLTHESASEELKKKFQRWLAIDVSQGRVEVR